MKYTLISLFLLLGINSFAQKVICEKDASMYSRCYILSENGFFQYIYNHCTGSVIGFGRYKEYKDKIVFSYEDPLLYDTVKASIHCSKYNYSSFEEITVKTYDLHSHEILSFPSIKSSNETQDYSKRIKHYIDSTILEKIKSLDTITIGYIGYKNLSFPLIEDCQAYNVKLDAEWHKIYVKENTKQVLKKKKLNTYSLSEEYKTLDEHTERVFIKKRRIKFIRKKKNGE